MPQIEELRRQRAGINEQVQALATIETTGGTLTAEQLTELPACSSSSQISAPRLSVWKRLNVLMRLLPNRLKVHSRLLVSALKQSQSNISAQA